MQNVQRVSANDEQNAAAQYSLAVAERGGMYRCKRQTLERVAERSVST